MVEKYGSNAPANTTSYANVQGTQFQQGQYAVAPQQFPVTTASPQQYPVTMAPPQQYPKPQQNPAEAQQYPPPQYWSSAH